MKKIILMFLIFSVIGCAQKPEERATTSVAPTSDTKILDLSQTGTLTGKVVFQGEVSAAEGVVVAGNPECAAFHTDATIPSEELIVQNGAVKNVFVYVKEGLEGYDFPAPEASVKVSNKQCVYTPHVLGVQVGQTVDILNEDPTLHNVHSYSKANVSWNIGLPFAGMKQVKKFEAPEVMVSLKCDVHPWMRGYIGVVAHPYFAVTGDDGSFEIKDLPPGNYTIDVWHEKLGVQTLELTVAPSEVKIVEIRF